MFSVLSLLAVAASSQANSESGPGYDSFEAGIPASWSSSPGANLEIDRRHYKHGEQSLRWDWRGGDALRIEQGLGDIRRTGGYGGSYGKATFGVWLYQREPVEDTLRFEFRRGDETTAHFDFNLNFTGWRPAYLWFKRDFEGKIHPETDNIRIVAPEEQQGEVFIDLVVYNGILDYRGQHVPASQKFEPEGRELRDRLFEKPAAVSEAERADAEKVYRNLVRRVARNGSVDESFLATVATRMKEWRIVEDEDGVRGQPVVFRHEDFYEDEGVQGVTTPREIADFMLAMGRRYHWTDDTELRRQLGDSFVLLARHLRDQGLEAGSGFQWTWYPGRSLASALLLMREPLREEGLLDWAFDFMDYNYGVSEIFDDSTRGNPHMDYFNFDTPHRLYGIMLLDDPAEQQRHLRAFSRRLSADILLETGPNGFKPDGSTWHHLGHYFAYAVYCVDSLVNIMNDLSDTRYRVTSEAYDQVKKAVLAMRLYANERSIPLSLHGRHPFNSGAGQNLRTSTFITLARANTYDAPGDLDPDLAAAYLRIEPNPSHADLLKKQDISAEPAPEGNWVMNYAGISMHRRDHWLALAKGYSKYIWGSEIYQANNRFGRYLSYGALEILAGGDPVNLHASGYREEGWDWNRLDGTTVIYLPLEELEAPNPGTEIIRSNQTFVGGLSHRGRNGAFVMILEGYKRHDTSFRGKKTYFFFDDKILALGSNIRNDDEENPTHTNLFQKHLPDPAETLMINGNEIDAFPHRDALDESRSNWLIDTQGTGYLLPSGNRVSYARETQVSRDQKNERDTEGDFATAWIDHGRNPDDAGYEYIIMPNTDVPAVRALSEKMNLPEERRPYQVIQKDERAHVVFAPEADTWAFVFFEEQEVPGTSPVAAVDRAGLVMVEREGEGRWHLSFCDPDLNLDDYVSVPRTSRVTLNGSWEIDGSPPEGVRAAPPSDGRTVLEFVVQDGKSFDVPLRAGQ